MDFQIRECRIDDAEFIYDLNCREMGYDFPVEETRKKLSCLIEGNSDKIFVATVDDIVVGYIHANDYDVIYAPHMKNIMGLAVSSNYKRVGIGTALLSAVETWAKETGACGVRLVSGATRIGAHTFYRSCGYTCRKQQMNFMKLL